MKIQKLQDYLTYNLEQYHNICREQEIAPKENIENRLTEKFNNYVLPHIKNIGNTIGEKDSVFNPIRKIIGVEYINGKLCVLFKEPRQRLTRYVEISQK